MLFYKLLLTRFLGMVLVLLLGACAYPNLGPNTSTAAPAQATAIWEAVATQTAQFGRTTAQPGSGTPASTSISRTPASTGLPGAVGTPQAPAGTAVGGTRAPGTPAGATDGPPPVVVQGRQWLAQQIDEPLDTVVIQNFERADWPDTCLGLGQAGSSCAQVITPGWRIVLYVNGNNYEVRTDSSGQVFRMVVGGKG